MLMRKVMAEQPAEDAVLRAEAVVLQKEAAAAAEVLLMMLETLEMLVEREDVEAVANLVAEENHAVSEQAREGSPGGGSHRPAE